jgi:hypothetical protein
MQEGWIPLDKNRVFFMNLVKLIPNLTHGAKLFHRELCKSVPNQISTEAPSFILAKLINDVTVI